MSPIWRRTGMNPYVNDEAAWQHIQDLQREAENRRMLAGAGKDPVELVAMRWLKRSVVQLAKSVWNLPLGRFHRKYREAGLSRGRKEIA